MPEGYYLRAEVGFVEGESAKALDDYRSAESRIEPGRNYAAFGDTFGIVDVIAKQGLCLQRLGRTDEARKIGERIAELAPDHKIGLALRNL